MNLLRYMLGYEFTVTYTALAFYPMAVNGETGSRPIELGGYNPIGRLL